MPKSPTKPHDPQAQIDFLAREMSVPVAEVALLYARELAALRQAARVPNYIHIFAYRRVRDLLQQRGRPTLLLPAPRLAAAA